MGHDCQGVGVAHFFEMNSLSIVRVKVHVTINRQQN